MIAVGRDEHLRLVAQAAKGDRMDDAVAVALKGVARPPDDAAGFIVIPPARPRRVTGARGTRHSSGSTGSPASLSKRKPSPSAFLYSTRHACAPLRSSNGPTTQPRVWPQTPVQPPFPSNHPPLR